MKTGNIEGIISEGRLRTFIDVIEKQVLKFSQVKLHINGYFAELVELAKCKNEKLKTCYNEKSDNRKQRQPYSAYLFTGHLCN